MSTISTLQVEVRCVYGTWKVYPVNDTALVFAEIAGTKTLGVSALRGAESLGYFIQAVNGGTDAVLARMMGKKLVA